MISTPFKSVEESTASCSPAVSIIIPAYQAEHTITRSVRSALAIQNISLEVIVVDDGSTDETGTLLNQLASRDSRLRVIRQTNMGRAQARNMGLAASRGTWVMFLDADDYLLPHADLLLEEAVKSASADLVIFGVKITGSDTKLVRWAAQGADEKNSQTESLLSQKASVLLAAMIDGDWDSATPGVRHYEPNACWARLYRRATMMAFREQLPDGWEPFPKNVRLSEDRLVNIACLHFLGTSNVEFMPATIYCWDMTQSGTVMRARAEDAYDIAAYRSCLVSLKNAGILTASQIAPLFAREVLMQFRRTVQATDGPRTRELCKTWKKLLADKRSRKAVLSVPAECLGDGHIWRGAVHMLAHGHVWLAFTVYRFLFRIKKLLARSA